MKKAALEIASTFTDTPGVSALWIVPVMRRFSPFKEGVAYIEVMHVEPDNISDWATKAAEYLAGERKANINWGVAHVAAVIATFAQPLVEALNAAKRGHEVEGEVHACMAHHYLPCTCGADEWNAKIDNALNGGRAK